MLCCIPFLYKPKALAVISTEPSRPVAPEPLRLQEPVYEKSVQIREVRIPDALMDIRNPSIKAQFKEFCKENTLCVACSYANPEKPTVLVFNGILHECPHCDSDEDSP